MFLHRLIAIVTAGITAWMPLAANAGLIRDAEIEHTLRAYASPIFDAANITPENVRILIVDDPSINAFVAGGLNIFVHTGLIRAASKPEMLIGVIAHETGHISGAHLSQFSEKSSRAVLGATIGALLGVAAILGGGMMVGGGRNITPIGEGAIVGSQQMAQRQLIGEVRLNENSADQAALTFLDAAGYSASGMLEMFETLRRKEATVNTQPDPFLRDHPLNSERISAMQNHIAQSPVKESGIPANFYTMHARMEAKLAGFMDSYEQVMRAYPARDSSVAARYARAIAEFKHHNLAAALQGINALIKHYPNDAFFYDTKGQILYENGKLDEAASAYANATRLMPDSPLMLTDYAGTLLAKATPASLDQAVALLTRSIAIDDSYATSWRHLAVAYGKQGKLGLSYRSLAEEAVLVGDYKLALQHLARARKDAANDPALALTLDDLERDAKAQLKEQRGDKLF